MLNYKSVGDNHDFRERLGDDLAVGSAAERLRACALEERSDHRTDEECEHSTSYVEHGGGDKC